MACATWGLVPAVHRALGRELVRREGASGWPDVEIVTAQAASGRKTHRNTFEIGIGTRDRPCNCSPCRRPVSMSDIVRNYHFRARDRTRASASGAGLQKTRARFSSDSCGGCALTQKEILKIPGGEVRWDRILHIDLHNHRDRPFGGSASASDPVDAEGVWAGSDEALGYAQLDVANWETRNTVDLVVDPVNTA